MPFGADLVVACGFGVGCTAGWLRATAVGVAPRLAAGADVAAGAGAAGAAAVGALAGVPTGAACDGSGAGVGFGFSASSACARALSRLAPAGLPAEPTNVTVRAGW